MALCSTNKETSETRAPTRPAHPTVRAGPVFFTLQQSPPRTPAASRIPTRPPTRDVTSHADPTMPRPCAAIFCPAMLSPLLRFSSACPLLTLPPPVPPLRLHHPLSYPRPPPGLASLCTCVKSRPKPAAPRCPPRAPVLDMDAAAADDSPARPSPPWYHLTASPAATPPGVSPGDAVHWPKNLLVPSGQHHRTPFVLFPPAGTLSPQHQVIYQGPRIMIGVA